MDKDKSGETAGEAAAGMDVKQFHDRIRQLYAAWQARSADAFGSCDAIAVLFGAATEDMPIYQKSTALHNWLLENEFSDTLIVFCEKQCAILATQKKIAMIQDVQKKQQQQQGEDGAVEIVLLTKKKDDAKAGFDALLALVRASRGGKRLGYCAKDKATGEFAEGWNKAVAAAGLDLVDVSAGLAGVLAVKDAAARGCIDKAARLTSSVLRKFLVPRIEGIIDKDKAVKHSDLADETEAKLQNPSDLNIKLKPENLESCYAPIIQSGGRFNVKASAVSDDAVMKFSTIICALGARYRFYCSNIARTFLIGPDKQQEENYKLLLDVHEFVIAELKPGAVLADVYNQAVDFIASRNAEMVKHFVPSIGSAIGLEFRDPAMLINAKATSVVVQPHMTFNVAVAFQDIPYTNPTETTGPSYALLLADTVIVVDPAAQPLPLPGAGAGAGADADGAQPKPPSSGGAKKLTNHPCDLDAISYEYKDDEEDDADADADGDEKSKKNKSKDKDKDKSHGNNAKGVDDGPKTRAAPNLERERQEKQERIAKNKAAAAAAAAAASASGGAGGAAKGGAGADPSLVQAYKSTDDMPKLSSSQLQQMYVDSSREALLVPINGRMVPFQLGVIKNISKNEDRGVTFVRINFNAPGTIGGGGVQAYLPGQKFPDAVFIREICIRANNNANLTSVLQDYNLLKKQLMLREKEKKEMADIVEQEALVMFKAGKPPRMNNVYVNPSISGKKTIGVFEAHQNGFRFTSTKQEKLDIMYRNIKHAFFSAPKNEANICVLFNLKNAVIVNKKKTNNIQVYVEILERGHDIDGAKSRNHYEDDEAEEQRERERRRKVKEDFRRFIDVVQRHCEEKAGVNIKFEEPFYDLGFDGVPFRTNVRIMPTLDCFVHLSEPPFLVLTMSEVEFAVFERVDFNMKYCDLSFLMKDYAKNNGDLSKQVVKISQIPTTAVENLKNVFIKFEIRYYENKFNIAWKEVLKTVCADPEGFEADGGWEPILNPNVALDDSDADEDSDAEDEDYQESSASDEDESSDEDYQSDEDEDSDEDDDDDSASDAESNESAMDWDEMEKKAREEDMEELRREKKRDGAGPIPPPKKVKR